MTHLDYFVDNNLVFDDTSKEFSLKGGRVSLLIITPSGGDITFEIFKNGEVKFSYKILDGEIYNANYIDCDSITISNPSGIDTRYERRLPFKKVI